MKCSKENICFNFPVKCECCKSIADIYNHYPCLKDKDSVVVVRCKNCKFCHYEICDHYIMAHDKVDPTDWNMTEEDYVELCKQKAEKEARDVLANYLQPFEIVKDRFYPNNMTEEEFAEFLKDVEE